METFSSTFLAEIERENIHLHSFALSIDNTIISQGYSAPVNANSMQRVFSICKTFTALAIGLLADEGRIKLDDKICKYFEDFIPQNADKWLLDTTIRNILMMRSCHKRSTYDKYDLGSDWGESFFSTPPTKEPGTIFDYDTSGAHILCILVEKMSKFALLDYIRIRLPELDISKEAYTLKDPQDYTMGGTGLMCSTLDMVKLGNFLMNCNIKGHEPVYISPFLLSFINEACSNLTSTAHFGKYDFEKQGYGYQIWQARHNGFVCYGMGGQFIMVHPLKKLVFVTTADTQGYPGQNQVIFDLFYKHLLANIPNNATTPSNFINSINEQYDLKLNHQKSLISPAEMKSFLDIVENKTIFLQNSVSSFTSISVKALLAYESQLLLSSSEKLLSLSFGIDRGILGSFPGYNMDYVGYGYFSDANTLNIRFSILDTSLGSIEMKIELSKEKIRITSVKHEETLFNEFNFEISQVL